jgi:N-acetylneuraminic acid mutarotase
LDWKKCGEGSPTKPSPRASQSAVVYNNKCYIFGGMDEDNTKFGDLWELDLTTDMWKEITLPNGSPCPQPRSGHSANIFNGKMYIFGGILELTKELNEMLIYDFKTGTFAIVGSDGQPNADLDKGLSH